MRRERYSNMMVECFSVVEKERVGRWRGFAARLGCEGGFAGCTAATGCGSRAISCN